jgi:hypothetical protein
MPRPRFPLAKGREARFIPRTMPTKLLPSSILACAAFVPFAITAACGGGTPPATDVTAPSASASDTTPVATASTPADTGSVTTPTPPPSAEPAPIDKSSKKATKKQDAAWADCHAKLKLSGAPEAGVAAMGKGCVKTTAMKPHGKMISAKQDAEGTPDKYPLMAQAGKCYRVYAYAEKSITDLDLVVLDSVGDTAGEDSTDDPSPVILEDGAICFTAQDAATVVVSVGSGKGKYALQIWSDE